MTPLYSRSLPIQLLPNFHAPALQYFVKVITLFACALLLPPIVVAPTCLVESNPASAIILMCLDSKNSAVPE
jgi:hypothetical protein